MIIIKTYQKILIAVGGVLLALLIAVFVVFKMATADVNSEIFSAKPSDELPQELVQAAIMNNEYTITEKGLNSYAAFLVKNMKKIKESTSADGTKLVTVTNAYIDIEKDEPCHAYLRIDNGKRTYDITAECSIKLKGEEIVFSLDKFKVGKLKISNSLMSKFMKKSTVKGAESYIDPDDLSVKFPSHYGITIESIGELAAIDITSVSIEDDAITVTTNPVVSDTLKDAAESFTDKLGDLAGSLFSAIR